MMVIGLDFFLNEAKQDPGRGVINMATGITNSVGRLTRTVVRHDANNNIRDVSAIRVSRNNILDRGRGR